MYIWSQDRNLVVDMSQVIIKTQWKICAKSVGRADCLVAERDGSDNELILGIYHVEGRAMQVLGTLLNALERGDRVFQVPADDFIEETMRICVAGGGFLDVTRTGKVVKVSVGDSMGHGCICCDDKLCSNLGSCLATLSEASGRSGDGDN